MLRIFTSQLAYKGPDKLDVTRKSAGPEGIIFAPSWSLLLPVVRLRRLHESKRKLAQSPEALSGMEREESELWESFERSYTEEMRQSFRSNRALWVDLLAREEVTLCCYCTSKLRCHRFVLARKILTACGASYHGERSS